MMSIKQVGQVDGLLVAREAFFVDGEFRIRVGLGYTGDGDQWHSLTLDEAEILRGLLELAIIYCLQAEEQAAVELGYE